MKPDLDDVLDGLGADVRGAQDDELASRKYAGKAREDALAAGLAARPPRRRRRAVATAAATIALAAAAALAVVLMNPEEELTVAVDGQPADATDFFAAPEDATLPVSFSDGTVVDLGPAARARVLTVDAHGAHVVLEEGHAEVRVRSGRGGRWVFTAGPFDVRVTGTEFELEWSSAEERFALDLVEGSVALSGPLVGEERAVLAGEAVRISIPEDRFELVRGADHAALAEADPTGATEPDPLVEREQLEQMAAADEPAPHHLEVSRRDDGPAARVADPDGEEIAELPGGAEEPAVAPEPSWQEHARAGRYREAVSTARARGIDAVVAESSAAELLALGDASRLAAQRPTATRAYTALRERARGTDAAASAAFGLGRVHFDLGDHARAATWFDTYLTERPHGQLAREALGRLFEAHMRAGHPRTGDDARRYLERYPDGPYADLARRHLGR